MPTLLDRGDYWQPAFRPLPYVTVLGKLRNWNDVKLRTCPGGSLTPLVSGLFCIGAHAMSPIGGVGINLAIQDAVAAANILTPAFQQGAHRLETFSSFSRAESYARGLPQRVQIFVQNRNHPEDSGWSNSQDPATVGAEAPAWLIRIGFRPEHVTPYPRGAQPVSTGRSGLANG
jgi:2-polyprenyl-6-methoxyphenol hydroxylase-like FAD-dependent oxidoreductase